MPNIINPYATTGVSYQDFLTQSNQPDNFYLRSLYSQYVHETGNGTSRIFREANNLFGMRPAQIRQKFYTTTMTTATGDYAVYDHISDSILDRLDLDRHNNVAPPLTQNEVSSYFQQILSKGYATDPLYLTKVNAIYNQTFSSNYTHDDNHDTLDNESPFGNYFGLKKSLITMGFLGVLGFFIIKKLKK